jgi:hypothetical protein
MLQGFPIKLTTTNPQWMDSNNDPPPANPIFSPLNSSVMAAHWPHHQMTFF